MDICRSLCLLVGLTGFVLPVSAGTRPNVVVILTDDQGWGDLSVSGNTAIETPNVDRLAAEGASFDRFFVSPVCSPTRAAFLTGRHHVRCGVYSTTAGGERLNADETLISDLFQRAGYSTAAFGKWHSGTQHPYHPNARGFEEFYGFCSGHWGNYFSPLLDHNGDIVRGNGYLTDDLTDRAMRHIEQRRGEPFFVYLAYNTPHSPMQVPDEWWDKFRDKPLTQPHRDQKREDVDHTRAALAMCENIDWNVGRLMAKLDELRLADNTIVVYFSDNGPNGRRWNGGMRGKKGSVDEGGVRSPLFVRWPARIAAGTEVMPICAAYDLLPTLADLCGVAVSGTKPLDGVSLRPLLTGDSAGLAPDGSASTDWAERTFVNFWRKLSVRTQRYRLDDAGKLYDMVADPGQRKPVNDAHPDIARRLIAHADAWREEMLVDYGRKFDKRPLVIGHGGATLTQLPARDGKAVGKIKRSSRFANDSFFTNWTTSDDAITWECEVGEAGEYLVELFYTCSEENVGATLELAFNDARVAGRVAVAHDPPLIGAEHDRVKRGESYVKDFRRMRLGRIELEPGRGTLTLRALEIPGDQAIDLRTVLLKRVM